MRTRIGALLALCCAAGACGHGAALDARPAPVTRVERQEAASLPGIRILRPPPVLFRPNRPGPPPLVLLDGRRVTADELSRLIEANGLAEMTVLMPKDAVPRYGQAAAHGAVIAIRRTRPRR
jgi:hypothetical protein